MNLIKTLSLVMLLGTFISSASANGTNDCIRIAEGKILAHDLNEPYLDNCYIFKNSYNSGLSVSIGLLDKQEGDLEIIHYTPSTGKKIKLMNRRTKEGASNFYQSKKISNDEYIIRINNLTKSEQAKNIVISRVTIKKIIYVTISLRTVPNNVMAPLPGRGDGHCDPVTKICYNPLSEKFFDNPTFNQYSAEKACSGRLAPPSGFSKNYDIEREANNMIVFAREIDSKTFVPDFVKDMQKSLYFGITMAPQSFYDLKTNEKWLSSAKAGNYNYGYLGAAIGIEKRTLIQMSGLIQIATNKMDLGEDYPLMKNLANGLLDGDFSQFDNIPEDVDDIESGYDAFTDGCKPETNFQNKLSGSGVGGRGSSGWSSITRNFIGASRCIGSCSVPIGKVTITDLNTK